MKLYRAETGKRVLIPQLRPNDGLDMLKKAIEKATKVPPVSQILMTSKGLQLKPEMMFDALTLSGDEETTIYVYNREVLTTEIAASIQSLMDQAKIEPPIRPIPTSQLELVPYPSRPSSSSSVSSNSGGNANISVKDWTQACQNMFDLCASTVQAYFRVNVAHAGVCERIMEELRRQATAVQVALTNLDAHSQNVMVTFENMNIFASKELSKQARLIQSFPKDIEILRQIRVHPLLLSEKAQEKTIAEFIPTDALIQWAEGCRRVHEDLLAEAKDLTLSIQNVQDGTKSIRQNSGINLDQLEAAMHEILKVIETQSQIKNRVERDQPRVRERVLDLSTPNGYSISTFESLQQLSRVYVTDYLGSAQDADEMLRKKIGIFSSAKNSQTANLISQLMHISKLQSTIARIPHSLGDLEEALRNRESDFNQLVYVQRIPTAYGAMVVEIVRRKEYKKLMVSRSKNWAEALSKFEKMEIKRREQFLQEYAKFIPVVVEGLEDPVPRCEVNLLNTSDRLPNFTRNDVLEFERFLARFKIVPPGSNSYASGDERGGQTSMTGDANMDGLVKLRNAMAKMTAQMDVMGGDFDRILEKSLYGTNEDPHAGTRMQRGDLPRVDTHPQSLQPLSRASTAPNPQHSSQQQQQPPGSRGGPPTSSPVSASGAPGSPRLNRQSSRGGSVGGGVAPMRSGDLMDEQTIKQQTQQIQQLSKENADLQTKNKAYEARIRSLEETLYQHFRDNSESTDIGAGQSGSGGKDSSSQMNSSLTGPEQPWKAPEEIQAARTMAQAVARDRKRDEERLVAAERELEAAKDQILEAEERFRVEKRATQEAEKQSADLRQELLELKLQTATLDDDTRSDAFGGGSPTAVGPSDSEIKLQKQVDELEKVLETTKQKLDQDVTHLRNEVDVQTLEATALRERIGELTTRFDLEKEILDGQLEQERLTAEKALERATELENELEVVNEELQNKVLELEEELESHAVEHKEVTARALEQAQQLESHETVLKDLQSQLKERMSQLNQAREEEKRRREEHGVLLAQHQSLMKVQEATLKEITELRTLLQEKEQEIQGRNSIVTDLMQKQETFKADVNIRLDEAKRMVYRAEEDWKEKSRVLEEMYTEVRALSAPIQDILQLLETSGTTSEGKTSESAVSVKIENLSQVRERLTFVGQSIQTLIWHSKEELDKVEMTLKRKEAEFVSHEKFKAEQTLATVSGLEASLRMANEELQSVRMDLGQQLMKSQEELSTLKLLQKAASIPVPISAVSSALPSPAPSPNTPASGPGGATSLMAVAMAGGSVPLISLEDRVLIASLSLELGLPLPLTTGTPTLTEGASTTDALSPTSSVLLERSDKQLKTTSFTAAGNSAVILGSSMHLQRASSGVSSNPMSASTVIKTSSSSSSTTVPLPLNLLETVNLLDLDLEQLRANIKRKVFDTEHLLKRWQRECKNLKEKYNRASLEAREKIAFRDFKKDDLTLFLPTRNAATKPWAAFNINFPHYFLQMTPSMATQLRNREWIVARITSITEAVVDKRLENAEEQTTGTKDELSASTTLARANNPFGLADGVKYYLLEATSWNGNHREHHREHHHRESSHGGGSSGNGGAGSSSGHGKSASSAHAQPSSSSSPSPGKLRHHSSTSALGSSSTTNATLGLVAGGAGAGAGATSATLSGSILRREREQGRPVEEGVSPNVSSPRSTSAAADAALPHQPHDQPTAGKGLTEGTFETPHSDQLLRRDSTGRRSSSSSFANALSTMATPAFATSTSAGSLKNLIQGGQGSVASLQSISTGGSGSAGVSAGLTLTTMVSVPSSPVLSASSASFGTHSSAAATSNSVAAREGLSHGREVSTSSSSLLSHELQLQQQHQRLSVHLATAPVVGAGGGGESAASASLRKQQQKDQKEQQQQQQTAHHSSGIGAAVSSLGSLLTPSHGSGRASTSSPMPISSGEHQQSQHRRQSSSSFQPSTLPISIPSTGGAQSVAANALRAISGTSAGSNSSGGSGSLLMTSSNQQAPHPSYPAVAGHHSLQNQTIVASSPPRSMLLSSSPHTKTILSHVSAMGRSVGVNLTTPATTTATTTTTTASSVSDLNMSSSAHSQHSQHSLLGASGGKSPTIGAITAAAPLVPTTTTTTTTHHGLVGLGVGSLTALTGTTATSGRIHPSPLSNNSYVNEVDDDDDEGEEAPIGHQRVNQSKSIRQGAVIRAPASSELAPLEVFVTDEQLEQERRREEALDLLDELSASTRDRKTQQRPTVLTTTPSSSSSTWHFPMND